KPKSTSSPNTALFINTPPVWDFTVYFNITAFFVKCELNLSLHPDGPENNTTGSPAAVSTGNGSPGHSNLKFTTASNRKLNMEIEPRAGAG
ncbi:MAG: hypothetical protein ACPL0F_04835, partial [bacterium]